MFNRLWLLPLVQLWARQPGLGSDRPDLPQLPWDLDVGFLSSLGLLTFLRLVHDTPLTGYARCKEKCWNSPAITIQWIYYREAAARSSE
jgi:hypothetical protein